MGEFNLLTAPERQDFSSDMIIVRFEADEIGEQIDNVPASVPIFDDLIDEAQEEVFIIDLTLNSSVNDNINITRRSSLSRIMDNDGTSIEIEKKHQTL